MTAGTALAAGGQDVTALGTALACLRGVALTIAIPAVITGLCAAWPRVAAAAGTVPDGLPGAARGWLLVLAGVLGGAVMAVALTPAGSTAVAMTAGAAALAWLAALGTCAWKAGRR